MRLQKPPNAQRNSSSRRIDFQWGVSLIHDLVGKETPLFVPNFRAAQRAGKLLEFPYSLGIALVKEAAGLRGSIRVRSV